MYKDRHLRVEKNCKQCGDIFMAQQSRIKLGQGRFCSLKCANDWQRENSKQLRGYESGKRYWGGKYWIVRWYDEKGNQHTTSYPKWWWTLNVGEVPNDCGVSYKDKNPENIDPSNFYVSKKSDISRENGRMALGKPRPDVAGKNNKWWRGAENEYPLEFSRRIKRLIKMRDGYICQCCYFGFQSRSLDVHHIDRNKNNNSEDNLVTVCKSCHRAIHGSEYKTNDRILHFQSLLK